MKVSIIVPVYNTSKYLRKCLDSLVNQTLKDIEIIVVNDGSTDHSQEIINDYKKKYKNIKSFTKTNGGLSDARNYGLSKSIGKYIGFVDSDDYVEKTMYEKLYESAISNDADLVTCDFNWIYPDHVKIDKQNENLPIKELMTSIRVVACNKLVKKEILDKHNILFAKGFRYEDVLFTYMILPYVNKVNYVSESLYNYLQRAESISNNQTEKVRDIFTIFDKLVDYYKDNKIYEEYKDIIEYLHIRYFFGSSYLRIINIKDKKLRKLILEENWQIINNKYPNWKKNPYLFTLPGKKNIYYRYLNKFIYILGTIIFRLKR